MAVWRGLYFIVEGSNRDMVIISLFFFIFIYIYTIIFFGAEMEQIRLLIIIIFFFVFLWIVSKWDKIYETLSMWGFDCKEPETI